MTMQNTLPFLHQHHKSCPQLCISHKSICCKPHEPSQAWHGQSMVQSSKRCFRSHVIKNHAIDAQDVVLHLAVLYLCKAPWPSVAGRSITQPDWLSVCDLPVKILFCFYNNNTCLHWIKDCQLTAYVWWECETVSNGLWCHHCLTAKKGPAPALITDHSILRGLFLSGGQSHHSDCCKTFLRMCWVQVKKITHRPCDRCMCPVGETQCKIRWFCHLSYLSEMDCCA